MKLKTLALSIFSGLVISACSSNPPLPETTVGVIEEVTNIKAFPDTRNNKAKLIKLNEQCIIEFTGVMDAGRARENWTFTGNTLISASSIIVAKDGTSSARNFDLYDKDVQTNFLSLRDNFKKENVALCQ
ncbi:hypothetical protein [Acinetobacter baylyi]|uniref:hypothetical protein n=1 Tax=Acinetobacter baylyi TaxID=202950 RepID=UPI000EA3988E|nr:hypothetical protein [Acinetobacter baylyi]